MRTIAVFDFDGTITNKDTLLEFIKFSKGKTAFWLGLILYSPYLLFYKFGLYPNWKVKEKFFSHFFKGYSLEEFDELCNRFFVLKSNELLYLTALNEINEHLKDEHEICIISASIENWVKPFAYAIGIKTVLCTQIEIDSFHRITGRFKTKNCYGKEKINRLLQVYPNRNLYKLIAYGDSRGDKEILNFSDKSYYKKFK